MQNLFLFWAPFILKRSNPNKPIHSSENMSENDIDETVIQPTIDIDPKKNE